jgi:pseudo-rSAM protein
MNEPERHYWLSIEPYVHVSIKQERLLLYNSLTGVVLEYGGEEDGEILKLVKRLVHRRNTHVINITGRERGDPKIAGFVQDLRRSFSGDLMDATLSKGKPIQMMPLVTIEKGVRRMRKKSGRSVGEMVIEYLTEVFVYINGECIRGCEICGGAYKQFPCCTVNSKIKGELDILRIRALLEELSNSSLARFNILGGNIFRYPKFPELTAVINHLPFPKTYYSHYANIVEARQELRLINPRSSRVKVVVPPPINEVQLKAALKILNTLRLSNRFMFIIRGEEEYEETEALLSRLAIDNPKFQPFFSGGNLDFFMEVVFTSKEDILAARPKMNDIYTNCEVNKLNFGRLTVLNNGDMYANVHGQRLGNLALNSVYEALYKEMDRGKSWRRVRKNVKPCKHCTFHALCPPLSNYSYAIGRNNLCHIKPQ